MTMEIPSDASRGETPKNAYDTVNDVEDGDRIELTVSAEAGDQLGLDDREETWSCTVEETRYDSRKNVYTVVVDAESNFGESGTGYVRHHPKKNPEKGLTFGNNSSGSRMWFDAPVDIFEDDRDRTVVGVEK